MKITFYQKANGRKPVVDFLEMLSGQESAKIAACLENVERLGFDSPRVNFRQIRGTLWEIKIKTHLTGYRFFYVCIQKENIILLHAYKKQSQKAPKKEIMVAETRMQEVLSNESTYIN